MYRSYRREVGRAITQVEERVLTAIGLFVEGEAKLRCPVDTGNLRASIDNEVDKNDKVVTIGTNVEYALKIEKGTSSQRAQPYLTPSAEENISKIRQIAEQYFRGGMDD